MNTIQIGKIYYFMYIGIAAAFLGLLVLLLFKANRKAAHVVLTVVLFLNCALHFVKLAFEPYRSGLPGSMVHSSLENICSVSTVLFPFLYLFKKQNTLHDFVYFIGVVGGLGALFYPSTIGLDPFCFDSIRFYICHITIFAVPMAAAVLGVYRPRLSRIWAMPLLFLLWEVIIFLNELVLVGAGLVDAKFSDLLDSSFRNFGFVFGVRPNFEWAGKALYPLVPDVLKTDAFNLNGGKPFFFPVLWMAVPALIYIPIAYFVISAPFWIHTAVKRHRTNA